VSSSISDTPICYSTFRGYVIRRSMLMDELKSRPLISHARYAFTPVSWQPNTIRGILFLYNMLRQYFKLNGPLFGVKKAQQTADKCHQTLTSKDATALMNNGRRISRSNTGAPKGLALHTLVFSLTSRSHFVPCENSGTTGGELAITDKEFTGSKTETTRRILSFQLVKLGAVSRTCS
jgi:hypothetical protein